MNYLKKCLKKIKRKKKKGTRTRNLNPEVSPVRKYVGSLLPIIFKKIYLQNFYKEEMFSQFKVKNENIY